MANETVRQERDRLQKTDTGAGVASLLEGLMQVALPSLSDGDLLHIAAMNDEVRNMLGHLATTAEGIGNLVLEDEEQTGAFQDGDDVPKLLYMISNYARQADALLAVAIAADSERHDRERRRQAGVASSGVSNG